MARLRCNACETVVAHGVPAAQAEHVARSLCRQCRQVPARAPARTAS